MNDTITKDNVESNTKSVNSTSKLGGMLSGRISGDISSARGPGNALETMIRSTSPETKNSGELTFVPLDMLLPFPDHPFKLYEGIKLNELVDSIKEIGVVNAIIIRKKLNELHKYEILSGHNRANAAKLAGLKQIKAEIIEVDDDTAALIVVDSNFKQRETLLPSERAFGFKMQLDAMKRQGKRIDLMDSDNKNLKSRDIVGSQQGLSGVQIFKYIRLTNLVSQLLDLLNSGNLSIKSGVELSYLSIEEQIILSEYLSQNRTLRLDNEKASLLRKCSESRNLNQEKIVEILSNKLILKTKSINFKRSELLKFFPKTITNEEIIKKIFAILEGGIN